MTQKINKRVTGPGVSRHRGIAIIYVILLMTVLMGFASFAVDVGRLQVAKTQLRVAADASARYAASGLSNILYGVSGASANAVAAAADNMVDGQPLVLDATQDVETGFWNTSAKTFTPYSDPTACNAVRITARRVKSRGTGIPMTFLTLLGRSSFDIQAQSIAMLTPGASANPTVPATSNPFLAGAPPNTVSSLNNPHNNPDWSYGTSGKPNSSPVQISGVPITPGSTMTFDGINGGATNDFTDPSRYTADGNTSWTTGNTNGSEHGIADVYAPGNCLIGLFLDDTVPGTNPAPSTNLDFTTDAARDFTSLKPLNSQLFFIGDGRTSSGEVQQFVVPTGATRLFIGTWDSYEWNNNIGSFSLTVHAKGSVSIVQ